MRRAKMQLKNFKLDFGFWVTNFAQHEECLFFVPEKIPPFYGTLCTLSWQPSGHAIILCRTNHPNDP